MDRAVPAGSALLDGRLGGFNPLVDMVETELGAFDYAQDLHEHCLLIWFAQIKVQGVDDRVFVLVEEQSELAKLLFAPGKRASGP